MTRSLRNGVQHIAAPVRGYFHLWGVLSLSSPMKMEERSLRTKPHGKNEEPNFQNIRLSFSSTVFILIWSLLLPSNTCPKDRGSGFTIFKRRIVITGSSTANRGKPLIFRERPPPRGYVCTSQCYCRFCGVASPPRLDIYMSDVVWPVAELMNRKDFAINVQFAVTIRAVAVKTANGLRAGGVWVKTSS